MMFIKSSFLCIAVICLLAGRSKASYAGPFLLWGSEHLNSLKVPTLQGKEKNLELRKTSIL